MPLKTKLKSLLIGLRHTPDRVLHPRRRRAVTEQLSRRVPSSVLFVCHGNVCRSPYAAAVFAKELPAFFNGIKVASAGFIGPGRASPPQALAAAERRGVDLSRHRSALLTPSLTRTAGLVVVMSASQARAIRRAGPSDSPVVVLGDLDPMSPHKRTIIDPWGCSDAVFDESYERIDRCVRELVRILSQKDSVEARP